MGGEGFPVTVVGKRKAISGGAFGLRVRKGLREHVIKKREPSARGQGTPSKSLYKESMSTQSTPTDPAACPFSPPFTSHFLTRPLAAHQLVQLVNDGPKRPQGAPQYILGPAQGQAVR